MPAVRDTLEYRRVQGLPRRQLEYADAVAWSKVLTAELRQPGSRAELFPWQAYALAEAAAQDGGLLGLGVGHGKTLITYLLPRLFEALRPVLVVPAALREKTFSDFGSYHADWKAPATMPRVISREELQTEAGAALLAQIGPDLIMIDECDEFANPKASGTRRLDRYIRAHRATCRVVVMTGTLSRKSILNYWHLLCWTLREKAPVPMTNAEAQEWALAIDEAKTRTPGRMSPGVLGATVELARRWYRDRLVQTPGVVIVDGDSCDAPLTVRIRLAREDAKLDRMYRDFLEGDPEHDRPALETPDGESAVDPLSRWRIDGQYGCGLYLRINPPPPQEWRDARRAKDKFVREQIARSTNSARPLDTEGQVLRRYAEHPIVQAWSHWRDQFEPHTEAVWFSTSAIESVRDWLAESSEPGVVFTGCVEFAEALARAVRLPYYGAKGQDQRGRGLHEADPTRSLIASWHACKRGFNLQKWGRQLWVMPPQSAKYLEQGFGRTHRKGRKEHVVIDVLATSGGTIDTFHAALSEATFARDTIGMTQKVLRASIIGATPRITATNAYRWARKSASKRTRRERDADPKAFVDFGMKGVRPTYLSRAKFSSLGSKLGP